MNSDSEYWDLHRRTLQFALRIIRVGAKLPNTPEARIIRTQIVKSGTSPGAHYREARRARSGAEFRSKMNGGLQELDETAYWLEILVHSMVHDTPETHDLQRETEKLIRIYVACIKNSRRSD